MSNEIILDFEGKEKYLSFVDHSERSQALNILLSHIRQHPGLSVDELFKTLPTELKRDSQVSLREKIRVLALNSPIVVIRALSYCCAYEALPEADKKALKRARAGGYADEWMRRTAPTTAQLDYLKRLGHRGRTPTTRSEASNLIDGLVNGGRR